MTARQALYEILPTNRRDRLGEAPWWSVEDQMLLWVDILGQTVRSSGLDGDRIQEWVTPSEVGFCVPTGTGMLLTGLRDGLYWLDPADGSVSREVFVESDLKGNRINDGKTDRQGRVWFGSMNDAETHATGALYRFDQRGVHLVVGNVTTSNGIGWSPDSTVMYHTDSIARSILAYDFDAVSGEISNGRLFAQDPAGYVPDGLTVDAEGCVWAAKWDGGRVMRYTPAGDVDLELFLPVSRPTSCCFVGPDLRTLAVTSAMPSATSADEELAGSVFLLDTAAQGIPEQYAAVRRQSGQTMPNTHSPT